MSLRWELLWQCVRHSHTFWAKKSRYEKWLVFSTILFYAFFFTYWFLYLMKCCSSPETCNALHDSSRFCSILTLICRAFFNHWIRIFLHKSISVDLLLYLNVSLIFFNFKSSFFCNVAQMFTMYLLICCAAIMLLTDIYWSPSLWLLDIARVRTHYQLLFDSLYFPHFSFLFFPILRNWRRERSTCTTKQGTDLCYC